MSTQSKALRFSFFAMIYLAEGIVLGYFASLNALYLLSNGIDMAKVGIFASIALIPFVIKIFFGMMSDRYNFFGLGYRKPYIVIGLLVQFACLLIVAKINPGLHYWGFVGLAFCLQMGMAFYDTCTDGLALDITPLSEKGTLQGFMVGGRSVGVIIAASSAGFIAEKFGWPMVFYFLAVLTLIPFALVFFIKETVRQPGEGFNWKAFSAFNNKQVWAAAGVGLVIFLVIVGANQIINPAFSDRMTLSLGMAGLITTVWGIGVTVGAIAGGLIMDKTGDKKALWISVLTVAPSLVLIAFAPNIPLAFVTAAIFGVTYGISQAVYFALAMKYTQPSIAASMFAILMAVTNIGQGIGLALSGILAKNAGYPITFIIFAALMFLVLPFLPVLFKKETAGQSI
jgi:MFS transporter, PAT family, beta-lactamase induction signal transducer AmpG